MTRSENPYDAPGVIVNHVPASTLMYNSCPSISVHPTGEYVASFGYLGKGAANTITIVSRSLDRGRTWERTAVLQGQMWSKQFLHQGALYIIGTDHADRWNDRLNGRMVIRRSDDVGETWTSPEDASSGLLSDEDGYHTAPTAVAIHGGRVWKAWEFAPAADRRTWKVFVMSAPQDADLLRRESWTRSEMISPWFGWQWIEGNMVVSPGGELLDLLRTNNLDDPSRGHGGDETAAIVHVSPDGQRLTHEPARDRIAFTGGGTKFTVSRDAATSAYLALVNPQNDPRLWRNKLVLSISRDLRSWSVAADLLYHPDKDKHAFQYVDWAIDGEDIVYLSRTAWDDGEGGPLRAGRRPAAGLTPSAHDANYITFHRLEGFRRHLG